MKQIILASNNPVKLQAAQLGFERMFPEEIFEIQGAAQPSGVSDQPMTDEETYRGALNRAQRAQRYIPQADYWVGIEGGVEDMDGKLSAFAWIVILSDGKAASGRTAAFYLPPCVADLVHQGIELGKADDIVFARSNSKQENGAVGLLTDNVIDRAELYAHAVVLALIPFKNPELYA